MCSKSFEYHHAYRLHWRSYYELFLAWNWLHISFIGWMVWVHFLVTLELFSSSLCSSSASHPVSQKIGIMVSFIEVKQLEFEPNHLLHPVTMPKMHGASPQFYLHDMLCTEKTNVYFASFDTFMVDVFWVVMPCSVVVGYQHFIDPCCLHLLYPED